MSDFAIIGIICALAVLAILVAYVTRRRPRPPLSGGAPADRPARPYVPPPREGGDGPEGGGGGASGG